ncbi:MAG: YfhO family protein, partial [Dehalococcoidia bacterium]|nr:YfhO family protein [Dehalococcoidia bacterium]
LAGVHTAEAAYDREDVRPVVRHEKPTVADIVRGTDPTGKSYPSYVYFATIPLPKAATVQRVAFESTLPSGSLEVYGLGLGSDGAPVYEVRPYHTAKYRPVYSDEEVTIYENQGTLPRAFLVPRAAFLPDGPAVLARLNSPDFDPLAEVLLEEPLGAESRVESRESGREERGTRNREQEVGGGSESRTAARSMGSATIREYGDQRVLVETEARDPALLFLGDSYYPGWRAYVDGREARIYRADYLFRAVSVPAGRHEVEFLFQPESFAVGLWISGATVGFLVLGLAGMRLIPRAKTAW